MKRINISARCPVAQCGLAVMLLAGLGPLRPSVSAQSKEKEVKSQCAVVGGMIKTNFISEDTTLGDVTGDLKGSVSAAIVEVTPGEGGRLNFLVRHRWVIEAGDVILSEPSPAVAIPLGPHAPGVYGVTYEGMKLGGGTGRFEGSAGELKIIGAADLTRGETVFRYQGEICFKASKKTRE